MLLRPCDDPFLPGDDTPNGNVNTDYIWASEMSEVAKEVMSPEKMKLSHAEKLMISRMAAILKP